MFAAFFTTQFYNAGETTRGRGSTLEVLVAENEHNKEVLDDVGHRRVVAA